jgi:hypothetical protein
MQHGRSEKTSFILAYEKRVPMTVAKLGNHRILLLSFCPPFAKGILGTNPAIYQDRNSEREFYSD